MPRKKTFLNDQAPIHLTARSMNGDWFGLPMAEIWDQFSKTLYLMTLTYGIQIHVFILLEERFHLIISDPRCQEQEMMVALMKSVSMSISMAKQKRCRVFSGGYEFGEIADRDYYEKLYKYVYRSPIEAGKCSQVQNYPFSTLRGLLGLDSMRFPAFDNMNLITHPAKMLSWLNTPLSDLEFVEEMKISEMENAEMEDAIFGGLH